MRLSGAAFVVAGMMWAGGLGAVAPGAAAQEPELPPGRGLQILEESCTSCHDLDEVTKFRGFYSRDDWRDIVKTMIEYGAKVEEKDVEVLVEYLAQHLGKK